MTGKWMLTVPRSCAKMVRREEGGPHMRAWITVLVAAAALAAGTGAALAGWRSEVPVYPPYPYKAGHYPTADSYYDMPPYAAINPGFYRWRYFLMAQERNRYRYMPHIFRGYGNGDGLK
jgi:hypothetical protein